MPRRFALVFAAIMSLFMSVFMSGVVTAINLGVDHEFVGHWFGAWIRVFPIAFVAIVLFRPRAMRLTVRLLGPPSGRAVDPALPPSA
jgi:hypothetical protein